MTGAPIAAGAREGGASVTVTRRARFSSARRLWSDRLDEAGNRRLFGLGVEPHGHDFTLYVTVGGGVSSATGMVMDLKALSGVIGAEVVRELDHVDLAGAPMLAGRPATTENLAAAIWERLASRLGGAELVEVELWEGDRRAVRYRGE